MAGVPPRGTRRGRATGNGGDRKSTATGEEEYAKPYDKWYKEHTLFRKGNSKKVTWWTYHRQNGWDTVVPRRSKAYNILAKMRENGKFDVVQIKGGYMYAVGSSEGPQVHGVDYTEYTSRAGNFLITNGAFFQNRGTTSKYAAVGDTSTTDLIKPLPIDYAEYYETIQGERGTFLQSAPGLMQPLSMVGDEWEWNSETRKVAGSLSHGSNKNERLALAVGKNGDKLVFVYTAPSRNDGLDFNGWRDMILGWLDVWYSMDTKDLDQLVNLDGGTSINVVWKGSGRPPKRIAQGSIGDSMPGKHFHHRSPIKVANVLVFSTSRVNDLGEESDFELELET